ncbi:MAG TPA: hypothetical protein P5079_08955, partial [Elusimicrobiota bacterium]|nr:hypothetical protein [Elusimicrobiota bacterium]
MDTALAHAKMEQILSKPHSSQPLRTFFSYAILTFLTVTLAAYFLQLCRADISTSFYYCYGGDALFTQSLAKGIVENGWYLINPRLGAPQGQQLYDYP